MAVAVVGPGAVGMTLAVGLVEAGLDVVLCGRTPIEAVTLTEDEHGTRTVAARTPLRHMVTYGCSRARSGSHT